MGCDKAMLRFGPETLLELALRKAKQVTPGVHIVGPRSAYASYGEVVEDIHPNCGPLSGIHAALRTTATDLNLILSVDMPFLEPGFLRWLLEKARSGKDLAVVPEALGGIQPLCAVYRRPLLAVAEQALQSGDYKLGHLFALVPTGYVAEQEILNAGFSPELFRNLNTPEEFNAAIQQVQSSNLVTRKRTA